MNSEIESAQVDKTEVVNQVLRIVSESGLSILDKVAIVLEVASGLSEGLQVDRLHDRIQGMSARETAAVQKKVQALDEVNKKTKAAIAKLYDHMRINVVPDKMDSEGLESGVKFTGIGRVVLTGDVWAS